MEERTIKLNIDKAKDWYNSSNADLKKAALQAYTEEELNDWRKIKTFEDACKVLDVDIASYRLFGRMSSDISNHNYAIYKLDIIRQALNMNFNPSIVSGEVYVPWVRICSNRDEALEEAKYVDGLICGKFRFEEDSAEYYIVGGDFEEDNRGTSFFSNGFGSVSLDYGITACKSAEIAHHMSKYFGKEIFEAAYIQQNFTWITK
jgi:hypothetical protein